MSEDEERHPFELIAESRQAAAKRPAAATTKTKTKQSDIRSFSKAPAHSEDSDDDDDDFGAFSFNKHQKTEVKESKMRSSFEEAGGKDKKKNGDRKLLPNKYPRSKPALQPGWDCHLYRYADGKERWMYSHPIHGETLNHDETKRTKEEWNEAKERRRSGGGGSKAPTKPAESSADGWRAKMRDGGGLVGGSGPAEEDDGDDGNDDNDAEVQEPEDELAALLGKKKQQEEDMEAMKERVHDEMTQAMDTGVKANPLLQKLYGGRR